MGNSTFRLGPNYNFMNPNVQALAFTMAPAQATTPAFSTTHFQHGGSFLFQHQTSLTYDQPPQQPRFPPGNLALPAGIQTSFPQQSPEISELTRTWDSWVYGNMLVDWYPTAAPERIKYSEIMLNAFKVRKAADLAQYKNSLKAGLTALLAHKPVDVGPEDTLANLSELTEQVRQRIQAATGGQPLDHQNIADIPEAVLNSIVSERCARYGEVMLPLTVTFGPVRYTKAMVVSMGKRQLLDERCRFRYEGQVPRPQREYRARLAVVRNTVFHMLARLLAFVHPGLENILPVMQEARTESIHTLRQCYESAFPSPYQPSQELRDFITAKVMETEATVELAWLLVQVDQDTHTVDDHAFTAILTKLTQKPLRDLANCYHHRQKTAAEKILFEECEYNDRVAVYKNGKSYLDFVNKWYPEARQDPLVNLYSGPRIAEELFQTNLERIYQLVAPKFPVLAPTPPISATPSIEVRLVEALLPVTAAQPPVTPESAPELVAALNPRLRGVLASAPLQRAWGSASTVAASTIALTRSFTTTNSLQKKKKKDNKPKWLRHWTIHRAWLLHQRHVREARQKELMRMQQGMFEACEELRKTSGPGLRPEGYLYRVGMEKKGVYGPKGIPIEYARLQTDTPAREAWNHNWTR
ncbi:unnamed protein product [Parascedosporium putredinis]|uniref:Uncharacterized protein n=1 Tax=Parascedosporium putredinis TaxID=1442378 RepID=A0A9P1GWF0_9PEZI|nr:unnamed protein product [Parascedosporium putredinis]CAI7989471.1 unnamed protein product [Parascedosporium putredinis]